MATQFLRCRRRSSLVTAVRFLDGQEAFSLTTATQNIHVFLRKLPLLKEHFFELLKTAISSNACGMSTLKSPLSRGSDAPHVHQRLRKHLARCTLDCGFKTPESPALRGFVAERGPITGTSLYLAFFFVLEKAAKSAENAVIPTYPMHRSHGLQGSFKRRCKHPFPASINGYHAAKNGLGTIVYKMAHVCFHT